MEKSLYWPLAYPSWMVPETAEFEPGVEVDSEVTWVMVGFPAELNRFQVMPRLLALSVRPLKATGMDESWAGPLPTAVPLTAERLPRASKPNVPVTGTDTPPVTAAGRAIE